MVRAIDVALTRCELHMLPDEYGRLSDSWKGVSSVYNGPCTVLPGPRMTTCLHGYCTIPSGFHFYRCSRDCYLVKWDFTV